MKIKHLLWIACLVMPLAVEATISSSWLGTWQTTDSYGDPFHITLREDGSATHDYADGMTGRWREHEGGIRIEWDNQKSDYLFHGAMGSQRLHKPASPLMKGYSRGMKRITQ